uniref:Uncharacterized protein n=1 Tax=Photinus pyralis TaxID=7054 RepID=A0A1Y1LTH9_PHOPY
MDWEGGALCQCVSSEKLIDPGKSKGLTPENCYKILEEVINSFKSLGTVPVKIDISLLDEGRGLKDMLMNHNAKWHKSCRLKLTSKTMEGLTKKRLREPEPNALQGLCHFALWFINVSPPLFIYSAFTPPNSVLCLQCML